MDKTLFPVPIVRAAEDFDSLADQANAHHKAGEGKMRGGLEDFRAAGEVLLKAKAGMSHGEWLPWLKKKVKFSSQRASEYMRVASNWDKFPPGGNLKDALRMLTDKPKATDTEDDDEQQELFDSRQVETNLSDFITLEQWNEMPKKDRKSLFGQQDSSAKFNAQGDNENIEWALWSWNPVSGCLHNCPYCLDPYTLVLLPGGEATEIGQLKRGDVLLAFDERTSEEGRQLQRATVEAVVRSEQQAWEIETSHGTITTTAEHRWLSIGKLDNYGVPYGGYEWRIADRSACWRKTSGLHAGMHLLWFDRSLVGHPDLMLSGSPFLPNPIPILNVRQLQRTQEFVDIQTTTRTFFAEGFATHNCYARDIAERFYDQKFVPSLWPSRLNAPRNTPFPEAKATEWMGHKNVFTCSMADLFGRWVPKEWIDAVLSEVRAAPQWNFLFLTKFPQRMAEFDFPENAWVGTTVDCQARVANAEKAFRKIKAGVKWLSCEPLIEPLKFDDLAAFDWLVLGGSSRSSQTPEWHPPRKWVHELEAEARRLGVKVYEKSNLFQRVREYPGIDANDQPKRAPDSLRYLPEIG